MFQDYMRSRLGLGGATVPTENPISKDPGFMPFSKVPGATAGGNVPPGFNGAPFHPQVNAMGWPGHPLNHPGNGLFAGADSPWQNATATGGPTNPIPDPIYTPMVGGPNTVAPPIPATDNAPSPSNRPLTPPTPNRYNPYAW